jgi:hypothetical protein
MNSRTLPLEPDSPNRRPDPQVRAGQPGVPTWAVAAAWTAVLAALPSVLWRALVGLGFDLGTPDAWRAAQDIPGTGTAYVLTLSAIQLLAALLALRLVRPGGDVVPRWSPILAGRRLPVWLVCLIALTGAAILAAICVMSILNWSAVDPFAGEPNSGWSSLSDSCYLAALLWPPALVTAVIGYALSRHRNNHPNTRKERT